MRRNITIWKIMLRVELIPVTLKVLSTGYIMVVSFTQEKNDLV